MVIIRLAGLSATIKDLAVTCRPPQIPIERDKTDVIEKYIKTGLSTSDLRLRHVAPRTLSLTELYPVPVRLFRMDSGKCGRCKSYNARSRAAIQYASYDRKKTRSFCHTRPTHSDLSR